MVKRAFVVATIILTLGSRNNACTAFLSHSPLKPSSLPRTSLTKGVHRDAAASDYSTLHQSTFTNILVVGGGFGGINTATTLASLYSANKPKITLIDKKERFVFLPLLYELCVGDASLEEVAPTYKSLLSGSTVSFLQREVVGIDVQSQCVYVAGNNNFQERLPYDILVIATGASCESVDIIPGASQYALPFYTVEQCLELQKRFQVLDSLPKVEVVIVGGGYAGVELALNTMDRFQNCTVTLVHRGDEVLQSSTDYNRRMGRERLREAGIRVLTRTSVLEALPPTTENDLLSVKNSRCRVKVGQKNSNETSVLTADVLLWTAGATSTNTQEGILNSIIPRDFSGRIVTGPYLRVKGLTNVFGVGDCSRAAKVPYPGTAQVAIQQATVAAWNVYATLNNQELLPFTNVNLGEIMSLGGKDATISSGKFQVSGFAASVLRRLVYDFRMPTWQQGLSAAIDSTERRISQGRTEKRKGKPILWK